MKQFLENFKIPIALSFLGIVLILGGIFSTSQKSSQKEYPQKSIIEAQKLISVDISGAVEKPGVYQLPDGARIEDAVFKAGGFSANSNKEYISKYLNMAQKLTDGTKIYVPIEGEVGVAPQVGSVAGVSQTKVNINTAAQPDIESLPGIGPVTASKIISGRPYQEVNELISKKVVSNAVFEKIKDLVVIY